MKENAGKTEHSGLRSKGGGQKKGKKSTLHSFFSVFIIGGERGKKKR